MMTKLKEKGRNIDSAQHPNKKKSKLRQNIGWSPNNEKPKQQTMFRQNLVMHSNDKKRNEQIINRDRTYDSVQIMINKSNKEETQIEPRM